MQKIAVTETIIGIHTAVEAARHAEYAFDNWLAGNRTGRNRRAVSPAMKQTGYIENIIRILPRINPAKQTPESCHSLIVKYEELADQFDKIKNHPASPEPVRHLAQAAGTDTLVIIEGLPGLAERELAANNPYADTLADALWHTITIAAIIAGVANELAAKG